jgi:acyl dehydratase
MRRTVHNYYLAARGVARRQRLQLAEEKPHVRTSFHLSDAHDREWRELYGVPEDAGPMPFSYYAQSTVDAFHWFIDSLGVNFRNVLHLQWEMEAQRPGGAALRPGASYDLELGLDDVAFLKRDRAVIACYVNLVDGTGATTLRTGYHFLLKNLSKEDIARLKDTPGYNRLQFPELLAVSRTGEVVKALTSARTHELHFPTDMGLRYGRVSGDMNIVHVNRWLVRLFGYSRTFAQGMCTANYVLRTLAVPERATVDRFTITFCRPVFLPGTVQLALGDGEFQVRDAQNTLAAVGTWRSGIGGDAESEAEPELAAATPARRLSRASMAVAMVVD